MSSALWCHSTSFELSSSGVCALHPAACSSAKQNNPVARDDLRNWCSFLSGTWTASGNVLTRRVVKCCITRCNPRVHPRIIDIRTKYFVDYLKKEKLSKIISLDFWIFYLTHWKFCVIQILRERMFRTVSKNFEKTICERIAIDGRSFRRIWQW